MSIYLILHPDIATCYTQTNNRMSVKYGETRRNLHATQHEVTFNNMKQINLGLNCLPQQYWLSLVE